MSQFEGLNTQVLGISVDSVPSLKAWAESLGGITYPLLSDFYPHGEVAECYGVLRKEGYTERAIFVVDKQGIVRYRDIHDINQQPHNEEVFKVLQKLEPARAKKMEEAGATAELSDPAGKRQARRTQQPAKAARPAPAVQAQRGQPNIIMYCTPWCPDCRAARRYLDQRGLKYTETDVSRDRAAEKRARALAKGKLVTPTFDIDGTVMLDFDRKRLEAILGKA